VWQSVIVIDGRGGSLAERSSDQMYTEAAQITLVA